MKLLTKLEKNKTFWFLLGISVIFFFLRLPSMIEPYWYGDEGVYQVVSKALIEGRVLYSEIWDNKPPLLYLIYAFFNGDQFSVRAFSLIIGLLSALLFFKLALIIFNNRKIAVIATSVFVILFATPILEGNIANAENFMLLPIVASAIIIYQKASSRKFERSNVINQKTRLSFLIGGLFLGVAFTLKTVAFFDLAAFWTYLILLALPDNFSFKKISEWTKSYAEFYKHMLHISVNLVLGFVLPMSVIALYFLAKNSFSEFVNAVFTRNIGYVGYANELLIPQGLLFLKITLFVFALAFIYKKRNSFTKAELFILIWIIFSFLNSYFSGRPYPHYALLLIPSLSLLIGLILITKTKKVFFATILIISLVLIGKTFQPDYTKSILYYKNSIDFIAGKKTVNEYQSFFDKKTVRDYELSSFIKSHTLHDDKIFVWGDSPQIYKLSEKLPVGRYTVSYHIIEYDPAAQETNQALQKESPKYIIVLKEADSFPFSLASYSQKYILNENIIYERDF